MATTTADAATIHGDPTAGVSMPERRHPADHAGKVAFITGGSRGLGLQLAREFARAGCRIAICARDEDELFSAAVNLRHEGIDALTIACDTADRIGIEDAIQQATDHFGHVDILVNNAGLIQTAAIEGLTVTDFEEAMGAIFWGALYATLAVLPQMRARKSGYIVTIDSVGGTIATPPLLAYDTARFAAMGLSERLRADVADDGIQVMTIAPGLVRAGRRPAAPSAGHGEAEALLFSPAETLPLAARDIEEVAREIVEATCGGHAARTLSAPASSAARARDLFATLTTGLLALVNRFLPKASNEAATDGSAPAMRATGTPAEPDVTMAQRTPTPIRRAVEWGEDRVITDPQPPHAPPEDGKSLGVPLGWLEEMYLRDRERPAHTEVLAALRSATRD